MTDDTSAGGPSRDPGLQGSKRKTVYRFVGYLGFALIAVIVVMVIYSRGI